MWQFLWVAVLAVASYGFISHHLLSTVEVVGISMSPTLRNADQCFLNRWVYHVRDPRRSDIVVIRDPQDNGFSVKRVVATPGDRVYLKAGSIYVNGRRLKETFLPETVRTFPNPQYHEQLIICGKNEYVVLGDNRENSVDSRVFGAVPRNKILGMIWQ